MSNQVVYSNVAVRAETREKFDLVLRDVARRVGRTVTHDELMQELLDLYAQHDGGLCGVKDE